MSDFKTIMKKGWHPEKQGETLKTQISSRLPFGGKKEPDRSHHVARPLSSLRDPASFGPPPKQRPGQPLPPPTRPSTFGASAQVDPSRYGNTAQLAGEEEPAPPKPFRVNTTGLDTSHLPPPPGRKDGADGRSPPPQPVGRTGPPSLPPRLPPRGAVASVSPTPSSPGTSAAGSQSGYLNQGALNRLGSAGISVPAFGIGRTSSTSAAQTDTTSSPTPQRMSTSAQASANMADLQNRFSKLKKPTQESGTTTPPAQGTTMEQKQAALRTASNFHKDPSSVSMSDARSAASTFNNFRQRHGEQVMAGAAAANSMNQKYGIAEKVGSYTGTNAVEPVAAPSLAGVIGKKKPPPPPPKKKPGLVGGVPSAEVQDDTPPPIPMATRPQF